jgi:PPOX class probable F420-dependent enzyme
MAGYIPWNTIDLTLRATRSIWIATTRPDGRPHAMPLWFWWDGKSVYFITGRTTQKARNLAAQPWAVIHAGDADDVVIIEGPVAIVTDHDELERVDRAYAAKYVAPETGESASIFNEGDDCYRVRVEHVMAWIYGTVAYRTDWRM